MAFFKVTAYYGADRGSYCVVGNFAAETAESAILAARLTGRSKKGRLEAVEIPQEQAEKEEREQTEHEIRQAVSAPTPQSHRLAAYHARRLENKMGALTRNVEQASMRGGSVEEVYRVAQKIEAEHRAKQG